jgi:hypothetical protein
MADDANVWPDSVRWDPASGEGFEPAAAVLDELMSIDVSYRWAAWDGDPIKFEWRR